MDTNQKQFKGTSSEVSIEEILNAGEYFTGSIYMGKNTFNWIEFNLVNRERMKYILKDIDYKNEVRFEIQAYVEYPEKIQRPGDWD